MREPRTPTSKGCICLLILLLAAGSFLRMKSFDKMRGSGFDENHYARYVEQIKEKGVSGYPQIVDLYIQQQKVTEAAYLPPTRASFLLAAAGWQAIWGIPPLEAVRAISTSASIALLLAGAVFAWRLGGPVYACGATALLSFAPMQIYMSHRALIDGFFGFLALLVVWALWEVLQNPTRKRWLAAYFSSLFLLILTKENAAFVYVAVLGILALNHWAKFGLLTKPLLLTTFIAPPVAILVLSALSGGFESLMTALMLNMQKSYLLPRAINTGDGPWFRYLSDLLLTNPAVFICAIGGAFLGIFQDKRSIYLLSFVVLSYAVMGNLRYGMNLRYANMWDFPICWLAILPIILWGQKITVQSRRTAFIAICVSVLCSSELLIYQQIFVENSVYDPVPAALMRVHKMVK